MVAIVLGAAVGTVLAPVTVGGIVVIVAGAAAARKTIQHQAGWSNIRGAHERKGAIDGVARGFPSTHDHATGVGVRNHEQRVADGKDRRGIDNDAIKHFDRFLDKLLKAVAAE